MIGQRALAEDRPGRATIFGARARRRRCLDETAAICRRHRDASVIARARHVLRSRAGPESARADREGERSFRSFHRSRQRKGSVMKKHNGKKLALNRETLVPLQPDTLDAVAGGASTLPTTVTPTTTTISRLICPHPAHPGNFRRSRSSCPVTGARAPSPNTGQGAQVSAMPRRDSCLPRVSRSAIDPCKLPARWLRSRPGPPPARDRRGETITPIVRIDL